jgi:tellurite resistance protein TehA-like permease
MHLRMPAFDRGATSFAWAVFFFLFLWLGMLSVGVDGATAFIFSALAGCVIFLYIRLYGVDEVRSPVTGQTTKRRAGTP